MEKLTKTGLGLLVAAIAIGLSAFKSINRAGTYRYYKTTDTEADDPAGYIYYSDDRCEAGGDVCSARWNIGTLDAPTDGSALPISGVEFEPGSVLAGHFE
jgi:hypothetical protein